ncbi:hypothetical protein CKJ89_39430, partial [Klebsiella pneumoniae]
RANQIGQQHAGPAALMAEASLEQPGADSGASAINRMRANQIGQQHAGPAALMAEASLEQPGADSGASA